MALTFSYRLAAVIAGAVIAVGPAALAAPEGTGPAAEPPAGQSAPAAVLQGATSPAAQAATVRYWTPGRMAAALRPRTRSLVRQPAPKPVVKQPVVRRPMVRKAVRKKPAPARPEPWLTGSTSGNGLRWTHGGTVADAVGKVFFTLDGADYVCSGALVGGQGVVLTAAHCVTGGPGPKGRPQWATNWMFVPGYRNGLLPYGEYTARRFFVAPGWPGPSGGKEQYDVAFVQVATGALRGRSAPPGLPVTFASASSAAPARQAYVFGYPSLPPYTGLYPNYCAGPVSASGGSLRTVCRMTAGDSGGPWLAGFRPRSGLGTVVAVSTYKLSGNLSVLYGAVLGPQARALYDKAVSSAR